MAATTYYMPLFNRSRPARFSNSVRDVRERANISIEELAEYCQVTPETIEAVEEGSYELSVVLAEHIGRRLRHSVEELFVANEPVPLVSATNEERIAAVTRHRASNLLVIGLFGSLLIAVGLQFIHGFDQVFYTTFVYWAVASIAYVWASYGVPGATKLSITLARRKPKKKAIRDTILSSLWFAAAMMAFGYFQDRDRSLFSLGIEWGVVGIFYGLFTYFSTYGWRRRSRKVQ